MKKLLIAMILILGIGTNGWAITYDLNYKIDGGPPISYIGSLGTLSITDNINDTNMVDVAIDLNDGLKLLSFRLNYFTDTLPAGLSITGASLNGSINSVKADGYKGNFDIEIPSTGNLGNVDFWEGTLSATGVNLDAANFIALDTENLLHVAVHIGAGSSSLPGNVTSLWAGDGTTPVPEPTTILLLGLGLVGLAGVGRKFKK